MDPQYHSHPYTRSDTTLYLWFFGQKQQGTWPGGWNNVITYYKNKRPVLGSAFARKKQRYGTSVISTEDTKMSSFHID